MNQTNKQPTDRTLVERNARRQEEPEAIGAFFKVPAPPLPGKTQWSLETW